MDFLDPKKKRSSKRRLYLGYLLVAIVIGVASFFLVLLVNGYGFNRNGDVYKNGLVFLSSRPGGANASITGTTRDFTKQTQTDARLVLQEGTYSVVLSKDGYRDWRREFQVEGSRVQRMTYPMLFPNNLETSVVESYNKQPNFVTSSPDRKWIVINLPGSINSFQVFDAGLDNVNQQPKTFELPSGLLTKSSAKQKLELVEWSTDNKHILIKHTYGSKFEYIAVNHDAPTESFNVNKTFDTNPVQVALRDKKIDQLYLLAKVGGSLRIGTVENKKIDTIANDVLAFYPYGKDMMMYVTPSKTKNLVKVMLRTDATDYVLRELPAAKSYLINLAQYNGDWFVAAGSQSDDHVYIYKNPLDWLQNPDSNQEIMARTMRVDNPQKLLFSASAQFISVQSGQQFNVYDAFSDRQYSYKISEALTGNVTWMDGHRLTGTNGKQTIVFDYDGINVQKLAPNIAGVLPMFDRDYTALYNIAPPSSTDKNVTLTRTKMLIE